jgi:hypothetical protein
VWTIAHPRDRTWIARYGADHERCCWASILYNGVIVAHDKNEAGFDVDRSARSVLVFLAEFGFIERGDIEGALDELRRGGPPGWPGRHRPRRRGVRRVLRIIENMELAGG